MSPTNYAPPIMGGRNYSPGMNPRNQEWGARIIPKNGPRNYAPAPPRMGPINQEWGVGIISPRWTPEIMLSQEWEAGILPLGIGL